MPARFPSRANVAQSSSCAPSLLFLQSPSGGVMASAHRVVRTMPGSFTHDLNRWKQGDHDAQFELERRLLPFLHELIRGMN